MNYYLSLPVVKQSPSLLRVWSPWEKVDLEIERYERKWMIPSKYESFSFISLGKKQI